VVKLGFIVEGATEKILLESDKFRNYLRHLGIDFEETVIDAKGCYNLLPHNIEPFTKLLQEKGVTDIIILTDLDDDKCITLTKARIQPLENQLVVVAVHQIEAWYLADTKALAQYLGLTEEEAFFEFPEKEKVPLETIKKWRKQINGRGIKNKKILAKSMLKSGFTIENAALHPNCPSAQYFIEKIIQLIK